MGTYREDKATQLAAYLLKKSGGRSEYLKLMRMLYCADREMLIRYGRPITFDAWCAMKLGPVLSRTYDRIKAGPEENGYWRRHIVTAAKTVQLVDDPGVDALSDTEVALADYAWSVFGSMQQFEASGKSHELFAEWSDPGATSIPITIEQVLRAGGAFSEANIKAVCEAVDLHDMLYAASATVVRDGGQQRQQQLMSANCGPKSGRVAP